MAHRAVACVTFTLGGRLRPLRHARVASRRTFAAMPRAELRFVSGAPPAEAETLVIVGSKERLLAPAASALVPEGVSRGVWEAMCGAKGDNGGSNTTWLPAVGDGKPRKLTACVLPSACSRHNSPAQPHALTALVGAALGSGAASVALAVPREHALASACAVARCMPLYSSKSRKADEPEAESLVTVGLLDDAAAEPLLPLTAAADAVRFAARLVDTPPAEMTTTHFRSEARETAKLLGARVTYLEVVGEELRDRGFGGIWGVGKAAMEPPALVVLSYTPEDADPALKPVALVGKGIIYDTGGLSLKVGGGMVGMKVRVFAAQRAAHA